MEADFRFGRRRRWGHELADGVENLLELGIVFALQVGQFASEVGVGQERMMAMLACTARALRSTLESMATPCSVKVQGRYDRPRCFRELITVCDEFDGSLTMGWGAPVLGCSEQRASDDFRWHLGSAIFQRCCARGRAYSANASLKCGPRNSLIIKDLRGRCHGCPGRSRS